MKPKLLNVLCPSSPRFQTRISGLPHILPFSNLLTLISFLNHHSLSFTALKQTEAVCGPGEDVTTGIQHPLSSEDPKLWRRGLPRRSWLLLPSTYTQHPAIPLQVIHLAGQSPVGGGLSKGVPTSLCSASWRQLKFHRNTQATGPDDKRN